MSERTSQTPSDPAGKGSHVGPPGRRVVVHDLMQHGYEYVCSQPVGRNFASGFEPDLTPADMLRLGIFGGRYMTDCRAEFPDHWFANARLCHERHDPRLNLFGVSASQPLAVWRSKGWIHADDPRGWFQWYCRYFSGRRHPDDARQIGRWRAMRRHVAQLSANCPARALDCRPRQRQALLQWAYDARRI